MKDEVVNILLTNSPYLKSRQAVGKSVSASDNYLNYVKEFDCSVSKIMKMGLEQFWIGYYSAL